MFQYVLTLSKTDTCPFTIEGHPMSMSVHDKGQSGQTYGEIRAKFALHFNKAAPTETNLLCWRNKYT